MSQPIGTVSDHRPTALWRTSSLSGGVWRGPFYSLVGSEPWSFLVSGPEVSLRRGAFLAGTLLPTVGSHLALSRQRGQHVSGVTAPEQGCARDCCRGRAGQSRRWPSWEALCLVRVGVPATVTKTQHCYQKIVQCQNEIIFPGSAANIPCLQRSGNCLSDL